MAKRIANITLTILLAIPIFSLISAILHLERQLPYSYEVTWPGDAEDQDDSDSSENHETDADQEAMIMQVHSPLHLELSLKQTESRQESLFREHHREVNTPPPKS